MRLINADAADVERICCCYGDCCHLDAVQEWLDDQPTIDAEPVVRCKDCKHRGDPKECYMCFTEVEDIEGGRMYKFTDMTRSDGFCHKGAKEEEK